jgi:hypothetical protein
MPDMINNPAPANPDEPESYTTPMPSPREEMDIGAKESMRPKFSFAQNPATKESRVHPDETRNPSSKSWTKSPKIRSGPNSAGM